MKWLAPLEEINTKGKSLFCSLIDQWKASREKLVNIYWAYASRLSNALHSLAEQKRLKIDTRLLMYGLLMNKHILV